MDQIPSLAEAQHTIQQIFNNIGRVIKGQDTALRKLLAAFLTGQHILLEDMPGTGKTTLAKTLSASIDCQFQRIQFTPDLLPSDILGVSIYDQSRNAFSFHQGPIFTHILLADEINRASPRTQSALLEAMAEKQVSVENHRHKLDEIFFVIATQNPIESHGTYPLPEAQMDRFGMQFSLGYVSNDLEVEMLNAQTVRHPLLEITHCTNGNTILAIRETIKTITVSDELKRYMVALVSATRQAPGVKVGASFRASLTLMQVCQALAMFDAQNFVSPEHVQEVAESIISHRLMLDPQSRFSGKDSSAIVADIVQRTPVPV